MWTLEEQLEEVNIVCVYIYRRKRKNNPIFVYE